MDARFIWERKMDDLFESSVNLEQHVQQGYNEGFKEGQQLGKVEGRDVGLKSGFQVGEELVCINVWKASLEIEPALFSARVQKNLKQLEELSDKYPLLEPENESVQDILEALRTKFRAISATLSAHLGYEGYPKSKDTEF